MAITSVALFVHIVVICAASTREVVANKEFVWYNGKRPITYSLPGSVSPVVTVALDMFKGDMQQVTGVLPQKLFSERRLLILFSWIKQVYPKRSP